MTASATWAAEMKSLYTMGGEQVSRHLTVADLLNAKGKRKFVQATATTTEDAIAAADAGIDMLSVSAGEELRLVRKVAPHLFLNTALPLTRFANPDELLRAAFDALEDGADGVYFCGNVAWVEHLAKASVPVMGHAGLVPRKSTWIGGLRAYGKTPKEARVLWQDIRDLENAGAYAVELEVVPSELTAEITKASRLVISSIGSGPSADIIFQFTEDTLGVGANPPRHVKTYDNFHRRFAELQKARIDALRKFKEDALSGDYPEKAQSVSTPSEALDALKSAIAESAE